MSRSRWLAALPMVLFLAACGGSGPKTDPTSPSGLTVTVLGAPPFSVIGAQVQLSAMVVALNGTVQDRTSTVSWASSDALVARVSPSGLATIVGGGAATITATFQNVSGTTVLQVKPGAPLPGPAVTGRLENPQTVADLRAFHQEAVAGSLLRTLGVISRWELPARVYIEPGVSAANVSRALAYWQDTIGLSFTVITSSSDPRIIVRATQEGLFGTAQGGGIVDATYASNEARAAIIRIRPDLAECNFSDLTCEALFKRVFGGAMGLFGQVPGGVSTFATRANEREINLLLALYRLPHGARVEADGNWNVVR